MTRYTVQYRVPNRVPNRTSLPAGLELNTPLLKAVVADQDHIEANVDVAKAVTAVIAGAPSGMASEYGRALAEALFDPQRPDLQAKSAELLEQMPKRERTVLTAGLVKSIVDPRTSAGYRDQFIEFIARGIGSADVTEAELTKTVRLVELIDAVALQTAVGDQRRAEATHLRTKAATIHDRATADVYRQQAQDLEDVVPGAPARLRKEASTMRARAYTYADREMVAGAMKAAADLEARAEASERALANDPVHHALAKGAGTLTRLHDQRRAEIDRLHRQIDELCDASGNMPPPRSTAVVKGAGMASKIVALHHDTVDLTKRVRAMADMPIQTGPSRMRAGAPSADGGIAREQLGKAAQYRQQAERMFDPRQADALRQMAAELEQGIDPIGKAAATRRDPGMDDIVHATLRTLGLRPR